jgi:N-acetylglutamate synthase-like GNAT family acetyltransferase
MVIKEASKADISILLDIIRKSFAGVAKKFNLTVENCPKNLAFCTEQRIEDDFARGLQYYMLDNDGQTCGCVALEKASDEIFYLERLAVSPEYRRRGFGTALVNHVFDQVKETGAIRVEIGIISKDMELKSWYKRFGFISKGTRRLHHLPFVVEFMYKEL